MAGTAKKRKASEDSGRLNIHNKCTESMFVNLTIGLAKPESKANETRSTIARTSPPPPKAPRALRDGDHKPDRTKKRPRDTDRDRPARKRARFDDKKESIKTEDSKPNLQVPDSKQPNGDSRASGEMKDVKPSKKIAAESSDEDPLTKELVRVMGFKRFKSTKNTKVAGNEGAYAVRIDKDIKYRQYMNRKGGFNRPLSPG